MRTNLRFIVALAAILLLPFISRAGDARTILPFDSDWQFFQGDASGAEQPQFADSSWQKLNVPHDWSIAGPFAETNLTGGAGAFMPSGIGWYRKHFSVPAGDRHVFIEFDGVMANSDVWINGVHLGHRPNGYISFSYELTSHLNLGGDNVIAVRTDTALQPASRWYEGAGIYRHVRLVETSPVYIPQWQTFITTPQVGDVQATVHVQVTVTNADTVTHKTILHISIFEPNGKVASTASTPLLTIAGGSASQIDQDIVVKNPQRWDIDHQVLYQAQVEVNGLLDKTNTDIPPHPTYDSDTVPFGIREYHFDPATGFWLNGKNFKIKGVAVHADGGAFGDAVPLSVWEERLKTLRSLGVNAIRTAHNPPAPEFLDLCDRMGFLVMDEFFDCWTVGKNPDDYHLYFNEWSKTDERDAILRDRNHPSIILYSVGNEIHDTPHQELAKGILKGLVEVAHATDPTRPVTQALFRPNVSHDYIDGLADMLDVIGQNYRENEILAAHEQNPSRKIIGTENRQDRATWLASRDNPPYAGQFLWSGIDYLGESRRWPLVGHASGVIDRTGGLRPVSYERQSWWSDQPMVAIARRLAPTDAMPTDPGYGADERYTQVLFNDWTPANQQPHLENVEVYSNCKEVELFLNGQSLGAQQIHDDASPRIWHVTYAPGTLKAVARNDGKVAATDELVTAGAPAKIILTTNRKEIADDWDSVAFARAEVVDKDGILVPHASNLISFQISGPGVVAAVDSSDNASHEPFQSSQRSAYNGQCIAYIKASAPSGRIQVIASSPGLKSDSVRLTISNN